MQVCKDCGSVKPLAQFYKHPQMADGHLNSCKACRNAYVKGWCKGNEARRREISAASAAKHRAKHVESTRAWWKVNSMRYYWRDREDPQKWAALRARDAKRRATKLQASPEWANRFFMEEAYALAGLRSKLTGVPHDVDHIVPLQSSIVCGLHAHTNLQVIPASVNRSKNNRYWPDMPEFEVAA